MIKLSRRAERRKKVKSKSFTSSEVVHDVSKSNFLDRNYKKLLIIPFLILVLAIVQISYQGITTGEYINKGVSLSGGTSILFEAKWDISEVNDFLNSNYPEFDYSVKGLTNAGIQVGLVIETDMFEQESIDNLVLDLKNNFNDLDVSFTVEKVGSALGDQFFKQTFTALIIAFILMGLVVFFYFKSIVPSLAVILSAFSDIVVTAAIVNLLGIRLSTAGVAAFLMLIGYSVDTDILLTTKFLKKESSNSSMFSRFLEAFKTGGTMTLTTICAVSVGLIFTESSVIQQIMGIVLIGLLVDVINTWIQNAGILRWYCEKKESKGARK